MFKVRNLAKKEDVNTEFWLEEDGASILLKAKRNDQKQCFVIASIDKDGMTLLGNIDENLGFKTMKISYYSSSIHVKRNEHVI